MGWRDVQAGVQSGAISYAPDEFKEGFARMGKNIVKRMNAHTDAKIQAKLDAEAEAAAERKELLKAQRAAEQEDKKRRADTKTLIESMGHDPNNQGLFSAVFSKFKAYDDYGKTETWYQGMIDDGRFVFDAKPEQGPMPGVAVSDSIMYKYESGSGGADALLNQSQNNVFTNIKVSTMPISEVMAFQQKRGTGSYHNWSLANMPEGTEAKEEGLGSTPVGKYQFVGDTLKDLKDSGVFEKLGIKDDTIFDEETQDKLFVYYAQERMSGKKTIEEKRAALKGVWEGLRKADDEEVDQVIAQIETGVFGEEDKDLKVDFDNVEAERTDETDDPFMVLPYGQTSKEMSLEDKIAFSDMDNDQLTKLRSSLDLTKPEQKARADVIDLMMANKNLDMDEYLTNIGSVATTEARITQVENSTDLSEADKEKIVTVLTNHKTKLEDLNKDLGLSDEMYVGEVTVNGKTHNLELNRSNDGTTFWSPTLQKSFESKDIQVLQTVDNLDAVVADATRLQTNVFSKMDKHRSDMADLLTRANEIDKLVANNEKVLTFANGQAASILNRIKTEFKGFPDFVSYLTGATDSDINSTVQSLIKQDQNNGEIAAELSRLGIDARDYAIFQSRLVEFAFSYARSGLGQERTTDQDFNKAIEVVSAGVTYDTFTQSLRKLTNDAYTITSKTHDGYLNRPNVRAATMRPGAANVYGDYLITLDKYVAENGLQEQLDWSKGYTAETTIDTGANNTGANNVILEDDQNGLNLFINNQPMTEGSTIKGLGDIKKAVEKILQTDPDQMSPVEQQQKIQELYDIVSRTYKITSSTLKELIEGTQ